MRPLRKIILYVTVLALLIVIFSIPVETRQGVNFVVTVRKIPLYVKLCGFLYRGYQYKELSRQITTGIESDVDKVMAIYNWTVKNIKRPPKGFTIVDDHIWNIIVRGYGTPDQVADVFTTLASYAGYEAYWEKLQSDKASESLILSFVKINSTWYIFDVYNRRSFISGLARKLSTPYGPTYDDYLKSSDSSKSNLPIKRPDKQKIIPRLFFELKKVFIKDVKNK